MSYILAVMNSVVVNTEVQAVTHLDCCERYSSEHGRAGVSMDLDSFGIPRSSLAESYGSSIFEFLKSPYTNFHRCWANLHPHQQGVRVLFSHSCYHCFCFLDVIAKDVKPSFSCNFGCLYFTF